jgi:hypothetical protein
MPGKAKLRPLWRCPKCGQRFVTPNMWHSCIRMSVQDHLRGKPKEIVALYRTYARMVRGLGPGVKTSTVRTGIAFMVRVRFAGATPQRRKLRAGFWLKRRIESPRFTRVEFIPPNNWVYSMDIRAPEDLDDEVLGWLREAYRVGVQEHVAPGRRAG